MSIPLNAQVTIGALEPPHESALLEVKSDNNDKGLLLPHIALEAIWDTLAISKPATGLLVYNTNDSDPEKVINIADRVRANNYYIWSGGEWVQLVGNSKLEENIEIAFSNLGVPRPALFTLNGNTRLMPQSYPNMRGVVDLLKDIPVGNSAYLPMAERTNFTNGTVSMRNTNGQTTIIFKPGVYEIKFVYEFVPAGTAESGQGLPPNTCNLSSYYMDLPLHRVESDGSISNLYSRIHSNCSHNVGGTSNHGNTINYITVLYKETSWPVRLGRGQAGNCAGVAGFAMPNRSTFLYISRIGDFQDNQ